MKLRILRLSFVFLSLAGVCASAKAEPLTVVTWGGTYQLSQEKAYGDSFTAQTGSSIDWVEYRGGLEEIRTQIADGAVSWDVVDVLAQDARVGCEEGLFERLPDDLFSEALLDDLIIDRPNECVGPNITWSWVTAFDRRAFNETAPSAIADFFDMTRYPGPRAIAAFPQATLEMALLADGVAPSEVYTELATEDGTNRAFSMLSKIGAGLRFWSSGEEPVELLTRGDVVMSTAYNGRVSAAFLSGETDIGTIFDGQVLDEEWFAVVAGSEIREAAFDFLRHVAQPKQQAEQARYIPYGPMRRSALDIIAAGEPWFNSGQDVLPHIPSREDRIEGSLVLDPDFWSIHGDRLTDRFATWRRGLGL